jgi:hypothetical protein
MRRTWRAKIKWDAYKPPKTRRGYERTGRTSVEDLLKMCHALGRLDELSDFLKPPRASSIEELKIIAEMGQPKRKRGVR